MPSDVRQSPVKRTVTVSEGGEITAGTPRVSYRQGFADLLDFTSPPAPLTRSVAAISLPLSFEIICWTGPPGAACTIKKFTTMIANKVGIIRSMRRVA